MYTGSKTWFLHSCTCRSHGLNPTVLVLGIARGLILPVPPQPGPLSPTASVGDSRPRRVVALGDCEFTKLNVYTKWVAHAYHSLTHKERLQHHQILRRLTDP